MCKRHTKGNLNKNETHFYLLSVVLIVEKYTLLLIIFLDLLAIFVYFF
jgi:hypothetical protein